jgi:ketosteroid isomerase-like protein
MKKKIGINIMLFVIILIGIIILSCSRADKNRSEGSLLKTDRAFSDMSVKEGMFKAFLFFMAEDGVILRDNSYPSKGKEDLRKRFEGRSDTSFVLSWEPVYEKIAGSGELGYTYGIHSNLDKATGKITKGTYITIWKKQPDDTWKFVLDTGTQGLPE